MRQRRRLPTMFKFAAFNKASADNVFTSKLYSNETFYNAFCCDLKNSKGEVIIESPFITKSRFDKIFPDVQKLRMRNIKVTINTRDPVEHNEPYSSYTQKATVQLQSIGVLVLYTTKLHRKLAIIDRHMTWEGSLNVLSYGDSCEIMRRIVAHYDYWV